MASAAITSRCCARGRRADRGRRRYRTADSPDRASRGPAPSRVEAEIDALQSRSLEELRTLWRKLYGNPAPRFFRRELLIRGLAYQMQVKVYGGLSAKTRRKLLKIAEQAEGAGFAVKDMPRRLKPGTRLIRAYKGVTHTVHVLDGGFEWNGSRFKSLSAIAREITDTSWNGNVFFGLGGKESSDALAQQAQGPAVRDLYQEEQRGRSRAGLQQPRSAARGPRGLCEVPGARSGAPST